MSEKRKHETPLAREAWEVAKNVMDGWVASTESGHYSSTKGSDLLDTALEKLGPWGMVKVCQFNILKYATRYPKTMNTADLKKLIHYAAVGLCLVDEKPRKNLQEVESGGDSWDV